MNKNIYYASITGKLPRKRKVEKFEVRLEGDTIEEATSKLKELIVTHSIRNPEKAGMNVWNCSETEFVDSNGVTQTLVMRSIFPCGTFRAIDLE